MIDGSQDNSLADYRARLAQALGLQPDQSDAPSIGGGPAVQDTALPPRLGPDHQDEPSDPDDPFSTPAQGQGPQLPTPEVAPLWAGQGPQTDDGGTEVQGGPGPADAQAAPVGSGGQGPMLVPQGGGGGPSIDGSPTPTLDMAMPNPLDRGTPGLAPQAPTAPNAPRAPLAPTAARAPNAPTAPLAPTINGKKGATGPSAEMSSDPSQVSPAAAHKNGEKLPDGRPGIQVHPDGFDPDDPSNYKKGAIAKLQKDNPDPKPSDIFDAMKPKTQSTYMDWWEKQHGDIEQRYSAMQQDLGTRPDPQRDPTKKEKFQMLMDFGISLLQHSGRNGPYGTNNDVAGVGDALRDATDREQGRKQADTNRFDQQTAMIQGQKQNDLKDLGNYGQAVREDALITNANTRTDIARANAAKPPKTAPARAAERSYDSKGNMVVRDDDQTSPTFGKWLPAAGPDGKPLGPQNIAGPRGGAGKGPPARQAELDDLINNKHVAPDDAINRVYGNGVKSSDPTKTWNNVYSVSRRNGSDADEAKTEADNAVNNVHGPDAMANARARSAAAQNPTGGGGTPPANTLTKGKVTNYANGQAWTLDDSGNPKRVK